MKKAKEKSKKRNTKDKNSLDLDNEIIIGIRTLPDTNIDNKKKKSGGNKKTVNKNKKTTKTNTKSKNTKQKRTSSYEEDSLDIEPLRTRTKTSSTKTKKSTKQQEIAKKKRKKIFRIVKWTTLVAMIIGGGIYFLLSPFFNIKSINIIGNEKITSEEITSLSGIQLEENSFKVSSKKVEEAIKTNAYIESAKFKRKLPDTVEIHIVERKPAYMITLGNAYVYINTQGYLLEVSKEDLEIPIIVGYLTPEEEISVGKRLCAEDLQRLNDVIKIMNSANSNEIGKLVTKIDISNKQDYILELKSEKKTIHVGDTFNLSTKMVFAKKIIEKEKKAEGEIFVNTDLNNKGAVFREKV